MGIAWREYEPGLAAGLGDEDPRRDPPCRSRSFVLGGLVVNDCHDRVAVPVSAPFLC